MKFMEKKPRSDKGTKRTAYRKKMSTDYRALMNTAHRKGLIFDISELSWEALRRQRDCSFCGERMSTFVLRREQRGYVVGNIAACCETCKYHKVYEDWEELVEHMKKVYAYNNRAVGSYSDYSY